MSTIRARGDKWQAIIRIKRRGVIVHQESQVFDTKALATSWASRLEAKLKFDGLPQRRLKTKTLGQLLLEYLASIEAFSTPQRGRVHELIQMASYFMTTPLDTLSSATFVRFATRRREEGAGPTTVLHNLAAIRGALNAAKPMYDLDVSGTCVAEAIDALKRTGAIKCSSSRERRPTEDELKRMTAEFARSEYHPCSVVPMQLIMPLAIALPRRLGELTDMRWSDFNKSKCLITLRDTKHPSAPRDEIIPVPKLAMKLLLALPVIDERILPYEAPTVSKAFQRVRDRLKIEDLTFHDLRHEGISRLFEQGLSIQEVALISGHRSWVMLRRYTHPDITALSEKLNASVQETPSPDTEPEKP